MKKNKTLVITGATGYIGSRLLSFLNTYDYEVIVTKRINQNEFQYFNTNDLEIPLKRFDDNKEIILIHLATFFSKDNSKKNEIHKSNIFFGKELLNDLGKYNLKKVVYTNSMFKYYTDKKIQSLEYTISKNLFSSFLTEFTKKNDIALDEIFLDNTFGLKDNRDKVIPNIFNAILLNNSNPVKNKNVFINLVYIEDIIHRLLFSIEDLKSSRTSFISNYTLNIDSIYNFLLNLKKHDLLDYDLIIKGKNTYLKNSPVIDLKHISLTKIDDILAKELKNYESH